jgi:RNA:NAD 2'-phosphotransferase (TPT1/KptA family)
MFGRSFIGPGDRRSKQTASQSLACSAASQRHLLPQNEAITRELMPYSEAHRHFVLSYDEAENSILRHYADAIYIYLLRFGEA